MNEKVLLFYESIIAVALFTRYFAGTDREVEMSEGGAEQSAVVDVLKAANGEHGCGAIGQVQATQAIGARRVLFLS